MSDRVATCVRCSRVRSIHGRGLCNSCYAGVWARGGLGEYGPLHPTIPYAPDCHCAEPIPHHLKIYDAWQCDRCHRRLVGAR